MTWAGGHCLHCRNRIPVRQRNVEFCSPDCASEYRKQASAERHGVAPPPSVQLPASVRTVAKSLAVSQRIRQQVDNNAERRQTTRPPSDFAGPEPPVGNQLALQQPTVKSAELVQVHLETSLITSNTPRLPHQTVASAMCDPAMAFDLKRLGPPPRRPAPVNLRGSFSFFPIGDLALVAPIELTLATSGVAEAGPGIVQQLHGLPRPSLRIALTPLHAEMHGPGYDREGRPECVVITHPDIQSARCRTSRVIPLRRPGFKDTELPIARQSQCDELKPNSAPQLARQIEQTLPTLEVAPANLTIHFLCEMSRTPKSGGAQLVCLSPPRPVPSVVATPAIPPVDLSPVEPAGFRAVLIPIPGLLPPPRDHKHVPKELAPWFVPSRPKPPVLSLQILETPRGWHHLRSGFVSHPAQTGVFTSIEPSGEVQPAKELSALDGAEQKNRFDSPWPRRRHLPVITPITDWWLTCSNQVKIMVIALPLLCAIAIKPLTNAASGAPSMDERPTAPVRSAHTDNPRQNMPGVIPSVPPELEARVENATKSKLDGFKRVIVSRAAVEMADDFQSGLDNWEGSGQLGPSWSYDRTGFIRPRALGIYTPSTPLSDYAFEFLGKIDQRSISWVFRASDLNNYYAMKLVDKTGGATPQMALVHYAVIEGREGPKKEVPLPITVYKDTLFRIRMDIQGPHFSVQVQGTVVDYWKDSRLKAGGIGFFSNRGEESRVRWVQLTHQDDLLGRLCAFLAPYAN